jgi:hypothetical protein
LEGFDDSFGTMKAIAEYFRDLAADDRYFGAEPPAPDVQMLAKIAEREITRRVDASTTDGGIVLRAQQAPAPAMPPQMDRPDPVHAAAAAVAPQVTSAPVAMADIDQEFETAHPDATASAVELVAGPEAEDTVSSPLVASGQATPASQDAAPDHPDAQSVAAKLQRIRAVVGQSDAPASSEYVEDQHAPEMPNLADQPSLDAAVSDEYDAEPDMTDIDMSSILENVQETDIAHVADDMPDPEFASEIVVEEEVAVQTPSVDVPPVTPSDYDAMLSNLTAKIAQSAPAVTREDAPVAPEADIPEMPAEAIDMPDDLVAAQTPTPDVKPAIRAQVLRLRKSELPVDDSSSTSADSFAFAEDNLDDGSAFEDDELDVARLDGFEDLDTPPTPDQTSLSVEEEAELMDELAEVERDFAQETPLLEEAPAAKVRNSLPETDDSTMSHILDQTDLQLNEPEGSRRRNAIAQLKAAVAATEAARQLGDNTDPVAEAEDAFRGDLNEVVRPRRPARVEKPVERTARPRPAPLKLVASQRVDAASVAASNDAPVAPRRVAAPAEQVSESAASNFAEFAENMGASALPDLLEAAAAYTAFVEGSEDFSRPQIMKKVQLSSDVEFSREDGLRSFGTLLREGRISKVRNGRFQVSDETRFRPETKAG